jgi:hypothetical protein
LPARFAPPPPASPAHSARCTLLLPDGPRGRAVPVRTAHTVCPRPDSRSPSRPRSIRLPLPLLRSVPLTSSTQTTSAPLRGIELRVDEPPFVQAASRCYAESARCNSIFQVFQMFQRYVAKVDHDAAHVVMVIHICFKCVFKMLSVSDEYCKCFIWMLHIQARYNHMFQVILGVSHVCL